MDSKIAENGRVILRPDSLNAALKEWAVAIRALREGRQILLLRKGGILDAGGEFEVLSRNVLLYPTYIHEEEQAGSLQPCYGAWMREESIRRAEGEVVRFDAWGQITDVLLVNDPTAQYALSSQHIYSDIFLKHRIESEPAKLLYALFVRAFELERAVTLPMQPEYYGCRSWIDIEAAIPADERRPAMSDHAYSERVRVTKRLLAGSATAPLSRLEMTK